MLVQIGDKSAALSKAASWIGFWHKARLNRAAGAEASSTRLIRMMMAVDESAARRLICDAQRKAAAEGRTLTALMEDGLRYVVSDKPAQKAIARPEIPVSKETGGMMPGIKSIKDIDELHDLEYIERLNRGFR